MRKIDTLPVQQGSAKALHIYTKRLLIFSIVAILTFGILALILVILPQLTGVNGEVYLFAVVFAISFFVTRLLVDGKQIYQVYFFWLQAGFVFVLILLKFILGCLLFLKFSLTFPFSKDSKSTDEDK